MAQTIKSAKRLLPSPYSIGGRFAQVVEVELGTEYKAEGVEVPVAEFGLPLGIIDFVLPLSELLLQAAGTSAVGPSIRIEKAGEPGSVVKIQAYGSNKTEKEPLLELAEKSTTAKEAKITLLVVGR